MEYEGCKEATLEVLKEATEEFHATHFLSKEKCEKLYDVCGIVDEVFPEINEDSTCGALTVEVDTSTKDLIFNVVCDEIILYRDKSQKFFELAGAVDFIKFSKAKPDKLRIEFGVSGLWVRR